MEYTEQLEKRIEELTDRLSGFESLFKFLTQVYKVEPKKVNYECWEIELLLSVPKTEDAHGVVTYVSDIPSGDNTLKYKLATIRKVKSEKDRWYVTMHKMDGDKRKAKHSEFIHTTKNIEDDLVDICNIVIDYFKIPCYRKEKTIGKEAPS
jgi:hypothetical protein